MWTRIDNRNDIYTEYNEQLEAGVSVKLGWRIAVWYKDEGVYQSFKFGEQTQYALGFFEALKTLIVYYRGLSFLDDWALNSLDITCPVDPFTNDDRYQDLTAEAIKIDSTVAVPKLTVEFIEDCKVAKLFQIKKQYQT